MRFSLAKLFVVMSGIAAVQAQVSVPIDWTVALPPCARGCVGAAALIVGCPNVRDIRCICRNYQEFLRLVKDCISRNCPSTSTSDAAATEDILLRLCPVVDPPTLTLTTGPITPTLL